MRHGLVISGVEPNPVNGMTTREYGLMPAARAGREREREGI
ncbi:MAG TPA: hypothetical protein VMS64_30210 [Candidatus Methylomirabilis sp.]|nr:hypothetical protein [Candidatus Methylomirabilis sp.]